MKHFYIILILTFSLSGFSQTQSEMNLEASEAYEESDVELNQVYQRLLKVYESDSAFISALTSAQRLWISYREAQTEMLYPAENNQLEYGSVYPMCHAMTLKKLTDQRTEELRIWLIGEEEGDVCQGSVKTLQTIDRDNPTRLDVTKDSAVWLDLNIRKDHRIFGYEEPNFQSKKVILFSVFTDEVEGNPFVLKHGAFYGTHGMDDFQLKFIARGFGFIEVAILKNGDVLGTVYFDESDVHFEK